MPAFSIIVLAGGIGSRLRPVLSEVPKVLAPVHGRPFLEHLLADLAAARPAEFVLCLSHMAPAVRAAVGENFHEIPVSCTFEESPLGTGGAIRLGLQKITSPWAIVLNGDSFCRTSWPDFTAWYEGSVFPRPAMVVTEVPDVSR